MDVIMHLFAATQILRKGQSYWKVQLRSGKTYSELDTVLDLRQGKSVPLDWTRDLVGSGDCATITHIWLCTPQGEVCFETPEPYSALQFKRGTANLWTGERILEAQFIGRLEDKVTGRATFAIWDVKRQQLTEAWMSYVQDMGAWHPDEARIGPLNLEVIGVRL